MSILWENVHEASDAAASRTSEATILDLIGSSSSLRPARISGRAAEGGLLAPGRRPGPLGPAIAAEQCPHEDDERDRDGLDQPRHQDGPLRAAVPPHDVRHVEERRPPRGAAIG